MKLEYRMAVIDPVLAQELKTKVQVVPAINITEGSMFFYHLSILHLDIEDSLRRFGWQEYRLKRLDKL